MRSAIYSSLNNNRGGHVEGPTQTLRHEFLLSTEMNGLERQDTLAQRLEARPIDRSPARAVGVDLSSEAFPMLLH